jgi:hypothetical protein
MDEQQWAFYVALGLWEIDETYAWKGTLVC